MQSHKLKTESPFLHLAICSILKLYILQYLSHKTINFISISAKIAILILMAYHLLQKRERKIWSIKTIIRH